MRALLDMIYTQKCDTNATVTNDVLCVTENPDC